MSKEKDIKPAASTTTGLVPHEEGGFVVLLDEESSSLLAEIAPTPADLPKLVVPSGSSGAAFCIEALDGDRFEKRLEVIVAWKSKKERAFFATEISAGEGNRPDCSSRDSVTGFGVRDVQAIIADDDIEPTEQDCASCRWAQYGSDFHGAGRGQACSQKVRMVVFDRDGIVPMVLQVPPASLKGLRKYEMTLLNARKKMTHVVSSLSLLKHEGSPSYFTVEFGFVRELTDGEKQRFGTFATGIAEAIATA